MQQLVSQEELTVHFIQDVLVSGEVQFSQVQVGHVSVSLLQETHTHRESLTHVSLQVRDSVLRRQHAGDQVNTGKH